MKCLIFLGTVACLFLNCRPNTNEVTSVFLLKVESKRSLLNSGFAHPKFTPIDTVGLPFDGPATESINQALERGNQNIFTKKIGDTTLIYRFLKENLLFIGIQIPVTNVDTTKLFNLLSNLRFVRTKVANSSYEEFVNKQEHILYRMAFSGRNVLFVNNVGNIAGEMTSPADSVRLRR